jgi:hypothetical protein
MTPDPKFPRGDPLENELRSWLRARESGPAPETLRMRVALIADEGERARQLGVGTLRRVVVGLATAGAAVAVVIMALALRTQPGPGGATSPGPFLTAPPTPGTSPQLLPRLPVGPWPRTGPVVALPLDGLPLILIALVPIALAVLLIVSLVRRYSTEGRATLAADPSWSGLFPKRSLRAWLARLVAVSLAVALLVLGCDLFQFSQSAPLTYGSSEGLDPAAGLGSRQATGGGADEWYVAYRPDGQIDTTIELANQGDLPLTVTSFDSQRFLGSQPAGPWISSVELRLPPGATMGGSYEEGYYAEAFHPFEIPAGGSASLLMIVHLKDCPAAVAGPSPVPGAWTENAYYWPTTGSVDFGELPLRYSVLGIEREADVRMNVAVGLVFGSKDVVC